MGLLQCERDCWPIPGWGCLDVCGLLMRRLVRRNRRVRCVISWLQDKNTWNCWENTFLRAIEYGFVACLESQFFHSLRNVWKSIHRRQTSAKDNTCMHGKQTCLFLLMCLAVIALTAVLNDRAFWPEGTSAQLGGSGKSSRFLNVFNLNATLRILNASQSTYSLHHLHSHLKIQGAQFGVVFYSNTLYQRILRWRVLGSQCMSILRCESLKIYLFTSQKESQTMGGRRFSFPSYGTTF